jgi:hypothetical protein
VTDVAVIVATMDTPILPPASSAFARGASASPIDTSATTVDTKMNGQHAESESEPQSPLLPSSIPSSVPSLTTEEQGQLRKAVGSTASVSHTVQTRD